MLNEFTDLKFDVDESRQKEGFDMCEAIEELA